jgi:hypothetical protein
MDFKFSCPANLNGLAWPRLLELTSMFAATRPRCRNACDVRAARRSQASAVAGVRHSDTMLRK